MEDQPKVLNEALVILVSIGGQVGPFGAVNPGEAAAARGLWPWELRHNPSDTRFTCGKPVVGPGRKGLESAAGPREVGPGADLADGDGPPGCTHELEEP